MSGMKELGEGVVRSYDERKVRLKELREETSHLRKGSREAQTAVRKELSEAKGAWQKAASTLQKKRHTRSK